MDKSVTVVVLFESPEVRELMEELLRGRAENIHFFNLTKDQKEFIDFAKASHTAYIFIYAFDDPKFAGNLHKLISSHDALAIIRKTPHRSILFCSREHRSLAYSECVSNGFFFYETIRPVYDMNKVRLLLEVASNSLQQEIKLRLAEKELSELRDNMYEVSFQLDDIEESIVDEKSIQGGLIDDLCINIDELNDSNASQSNTKTLASGLSDFKTHNEGYFSELGEQVNKAKPKMRNNEPMVIVADDQKMMLKIITTILKPKGFRVETASNGAEALMKAKVFPPDAVLLDIDMPVMNGLDTLKAFKKLDVLRNIPIIMLTSNSDKNSFVECLELGAKDYIVKPTNAEILLKKLMAVV